MDDANTPFIIRGITTKGARFRPSDWADRLAGAFAVIDPNHRTNYSPYVQPTTLDGIPCVTVDKKLKASDPAPTSFCRLLPRPTNCRPKTPTDRSQSTE